MMMSQVAHGSRRVARNPIFGAVSRRVVGVLSLLAITWGLSACAEARAESPLTNVYESPEELVTAVLEVLVQDDEAALEEFLITQAEYEEVLWPEMPDGEYTPFDFFWGMVRAGQRKGLGQLVSRYGGMNLELVSITMPTEESDLESYESFTFHKRVEVIVRNRDTGEEGELPSFDVFLEHRGVWKLANYDEL